VSKPYTYVEPILEDGSGPLEHAAIFVYVRTNNARRAKVLALRYWRRPRTDRPIEESSRAIHRALQDDMDCNPFTEMKAERMPEDEGAWLKYESGMDTTDREKIAAEAINNAYRGAALGFGP
jgi:hypothetical protein